MSTMRTIWKWAGEFLRALRIFSLSLALGATGFGALAAWKDGSMEDPGSPRTIFLILLVTLAGLASQGGANLINDYFEGSFKYDDPSRRKLRFLGRERSAFDVFVFIAGIAALGLAGLIGIYLIYLTDGIMLLIGFTGLLGSYAYTGEPFVYKRKGLGVILSFLLMGPLMLLGAYYPYGGGLSWYPIVLGLPLSLLIPALMLSNEMRDFKHDKRLNMGTMSARLGSRFSLRLYEGLVFGSLGLTLLYTILGIYPPLSLSALLLLPAAWKAHSRVARFEGRGIPLTGRLHSGLLLLLGLSLLIG